MGLRGYEVGCLRAASRLGAGLRGAGHHEGSELLSALHLLRQDRGIDERANELIVAGFDGLEHLYRQGAAPL